MTALQMIRNVVTPQLPSSKLPAVLPPGQNNLLTGLNDSQVMNLFDATSTIWKGVTVKAEAFASVEWNLNRKNMGNKNQKPVDTHPSLVMFNQANDLQDGFDFRTTYHMTMTILGKVYVYTPIHPRLGKPVSQYLLRPDRMQVVPDETGRRIKEYIYTQPDGSKKPYSPKEISFRRLPDPRSLLDGKGAVEVLLSELVIARLTRQWQENFFKKNGSPGGIYSFKEALEESEMQEVLERIRTRIGDDIILDNEGKYERVTPTMKEMQFGELRRDNRESQLEGLGISKLFLGQATEVNRASAETLEMIFAKYHQLPDLQRYKSWLNNDILPMYGDARLYEYDFVSPVKPDIEWQAKAISAARELIDMGADPMEVADFLGLPPFKFDKPQPAPAVDYTSGGKDTPDETEPTKEQEPKELVQN